MAGGFGQGFYDAVTVAVNATGQQGVADLGAAFKQANADVAAFEAQLKAGAPINAQALADLAKLRMAALEAGEAFTAGQRVAAGLPAQLQATGSAARGASDAFLQLSRGLEDLATGGPIGVLNNLPGIARGIGTAFKATAPQIAAAETAVGLFGTAAFLAYSHWDRIKALFDDGTGPKLLPDLKQLAAELDALKDKKLPSLIDQQDIKILERQVQLLERQKAAVAAQSGQTEDQKASGQAFNKGVVEATDGDRGKLVEALIAARGGTKDTPELEQIRKKIAAIDVQIADTRKYAESGGAEGYEQLEDLERKRSRIADTVTGQKAVDRGRVEQGVNELLGRAGSGDAKALGEITRLVDQNRNKTDAQGIDTNRLLRSLDQADPANIRAAREAKEHKAEQAEIERGEREIEREVESRVRDAVRSIKGGVDDALEDGIQSALKSGLTRDQAAAKARPALLGALQGRGVDTYIQQKVADALLAAAGDKAENNVAEGSDSKLGRQAKQAREKAINAAVARTRGGYSAEAERALFDAIKGGADPTTAGQGEHRDLTKALRDRGDVPADLVDEVATRILDQARDKALNDLDSGQKPAIIAKEHSAAEVEAKKSGFLPELEARIAANRRAIQGGANVARSSRDVHTFETTGTPYVLPEPELRRRLAGEVATNLRAAGADPRHAAGIVGIAAGHVDEGMTKAFAQTGSQFAAVAGVVGQTQGHVLQAQAQLAKQAGMLDTLRRRNSQLDANGKRVENMQRQGGRLRPSLLQY